MDDPFDTTVFDCLTTKVGIVAATSFLVTFGDVLSDHLGRIDTAWAVKNGEARVDAVTELETDAATAGARRLERTCTMILAAPPRDDYELTGLMGRLRADSRIFQLALRLFWDQRAVASALRITSPSLSRYDDARDEGVMVQAC